MKSRKLTYERRIGGQKGKRVLKRGSNRKICLYGNLGKAFESQEDEVNGKERVECARRCD
jgi:hypothetical protein